VKGDGIERNKSQSARYDKLAADQGDSLGQSPYGLVLERDEGIGMDKGLAGHFYELAIL
jgi:TPR repeat protein